MLFLYSNSQPFLVVSVSQTTLNPNPPKVQAGKIPAIVTTTISRPPNPNSHEKAKDATLPITIRPPSHTYHVMGLPRISQAPRSSGHENCTPKLLVMRRAQPYATKKSGLRPAWLPFGICDWASGCNNGKLVCFREGAKKGSPDPMVNYSEDRQADETWRGCGRVRNGKEIGRGAWVTYKLELSTLSDQYLLIPTHLYSN